MDDMDPIEVRRYGSAGPTVIVLHGGQGRPGSAAGLARALAPDFQVIEPLQRRSGRAPLTVSRHVEDLAAIVRGPTVLIGCSWGAMLGLSFAARYPRAVSDLVLVGCGTYSEGSQLGAAYMRAESYDLIEEEVGPSEAGLPVDEAGHVETWRDVLRLQREGVEPDAFRAISARVLMLHGQVDPHPGAATGDILCKFIPHLEYVELSRCGHEPGASVVPGTGSSR